jgi:hypothetical protein
MQDAFWQQQSKALCQLQRPENRILIDQKGIKMFKRVW